jgi:hypothetical protein
MCWTVEGSTARMIHMTFDFRTNGRGGAPLNGAELPTADVLRKREMRQRSSFLGHGLAITFPE